ncbi:MAG: FecR domain-containing protein, partial [Verrucomicrobiota bacterium]
MSKNISLKLAGAVLFFFLISIGASPAEVASANASEENKSLLLTAAGKVDVAHKGSATWQPGQTNQVLNIGDRLRTGKSSRATVRLSNLSVLRVYELTTLEIQPPEKEGRAALNLESGAAYFFNRDKP